MDFQVRTLIFYPDLTILVVESIAESDTEQLVSDRDTNQIVTDTARPTSNQTDNGGIPGFDPTALMSNPLLGSRKRR